MIRPVDPGAAPLWTALDLNAPGKRSGAFELVWSDNANPLGVYPVPVMCVVGGDGPTVLLTGAVHGDEYEGTVALRRLYHSVDPARLRGRLIILPQLNAPAFNAATRCSPLDGVNLNRSFASDNSDSPTQQIAALITECLLPVSDAVIDLHSGGKASWFTPCALAARTVDGMLDEDNMALAHAFGADTIWVLPGGTGNGSLNNAATAQNVPCIAAELGGGGHVGLDALAVAETGLRGVLGHLGLLDHSAPAARSPRIVELLRPAARITAPRRGIYQPAIAAGSPVQAGQTLGWLLDPDDAERPALGITAHDDGLVLAETRRGLLDAGEFIAFLATPVA